LPDSSLRASSVITADTNGSDAQWTHPTQLERADLILRIHSARWRTYLNQPGSTGPLYSARSNIPAGRDGPEMRAENRRYHA